MCAKQIEAYGSWTSPLDADTASGAFVSYSELKGEDEELYYLELRPRERGRSTLIRRLPTGETIELVPAPFDVRTRVHEYGGGSYTVKNRTVYFVNRSDQNIYQCDVSDAKRKISRLTDTDVDVRYANIAVDPNNNRLVCVRESHHEGKQVENDLVSISNDDGDTNILHRGHDFYASPQFSPDGSSLIFLAWDLPRMPWDETLLYKGTIDQHGLLDELSVVCGGECESIFQPTWLDSQRILYVSDRSGYWNLYLYENGESRHLIADDAEYGLPQWVFEMRTYVALNDNLLYAVRKGEDDVDLVRCDLQSLSWNRVHSQGLSSISYPVKYQSGIAFIASFPNDLPSIVSIDDSEPGRYVVIQRPGKLTLTHESIAVARPITYQNSDDLQVHANFYSPKNSDYQGGPHERPPLVVMAHGGPTSQTSSGFNFKIQYFTTRGWAVLDVNYGGSTGYGRAYRNRLLNNWGIVDVEDCIAGVKFLTERGWVDRNRVAIRGGSAGGFTTLCALAASDVFHVGASYYGVASLEWLATQTHKFESQYLHSLVQPELMKNRSPIQHAAKVHVPVIFYQGTEDAVVPPNQTQTMFDALAERGQPTVMFLFEGEGHGFRNATSNRTALQSECLFYSKILNIEVDDSDMSCFDDSSRANIRW